MSQIWISRYSCISIHYTAHFPRYSLHTQTDKFRILSVEVCIFLFQSCTYTLFLLMSTTAVQKHWQRKKESLHSHIAAFDSDNTSSKETAGKFPKT